MIEIEAGALNRLIVVLCFADRPVWAELIELARDRSGTQDVCLMDILHVSMLRAKWRQ